jgi:hypothetical protein
MYFNIHLDDEIGHQIITMAKKIGQSNEDLIGEAIRQWLQRQPQNKWPKEVMTFTGIQDFPRFESYRSELQPLNQDPLA